ncbi:MAG: VOC family protein [Chloroflexi bacterium]|nr:VOC family protein [Chloroflexota bacterium]
MGNPVTWFEINSHNSMALRDFYADLFGWQMEPYPEGPPYAIVDTGRAGAIGGGIGEADGPSRVLFYIEVDDPQAHLDRILQAGGTMVVPVTEIPGATTFAHFADPEGNVLGIYHPADR